MKSLLTLYAPKSSTMHPMTASLPTGTVTFVIDSPNFGSSGKIIIILIIKTINKKKALMMMIVR